MFHNGTTQPTNIHKIQKIYNTKDEAWSLCACSTLVYNGFIFPFFLTLPSLHLGVSGPAEDIRKYRNNSRIQKLILTATKKRTLANVTKYHNDKEWYRNDKIKRYKYISANNSPSHLLLHICVWPWINGFNEISM